MHPTRALAPALAPGAMFRRWLALAASLMFLSACAELPEQVERPVSKSLATPEGTALGTLTQTLRRSSSAGDAASGFLLVGVTGFFWGTYEDYNFVEDGWLLALSALYLLVGVICVPLMDFALRRA